MSSHRYSDTSAYDYIRPAHLAQLDPAPPLVWIVAEQATDNIPIPFYAALPQADTNILTFPTPGACFLALDLCQTTPTALMCYSFGHTSYQRSIPISINESSATVFESLKNVDANLTLSISAKQYQRLHTMTLNFLPKFVGLLQEICQHRDFFEQPLDLLSVHRCLFTRSIVLNTLKSGNVAIFGRTPQSDAIVRYDLDFDFASCTIRSSDNSVWMSDINSVDPQIGTNAITLSSFLHEKFGMKVSGQHKTTINNQSKSSFDFSRIEDSNQFSFGSNDQFVSQLLQHWQNAVSVEELLTICKQVMAFFDRQRDKNATSGIKHTASVSNPTGAVASPTASSSSIGSGNGWLSDLIQTWSPLVLQSIAQQDSYMMPETVLHQSVDERRVIQSFLQCSSQIVCRLAVLGDVQQIVGTFSEKFTQFPRSIGLISLLRSVLLHSAPFRRVVSANHWLCQTLLQWHSEGRETLLSAAKTARGMSSREFQSAPEPKFSKFTHQFPLLSQPLFEAFSPSYLQQQGLYQLSSTSSPPQLSVQLPPIDVPFQFSPIHHDVNSGNVTGLTEGSPSARQSAGLLLGTPRQQANTPAAGSIGNSAMPDKRIAFQFPTQTANLSTAATASLHLPPVSLNRYSARASTRRSEHSVDQNFSDRASHRASRRDVAAAASVAVGAVPALSLSLVSSTTGPASSMRSSTRFSRRLSLRQQTSFLSQSLDFKNSATGKHSGRQLFASWSGSLKSMPDKQTLQLPGLLPVSRSSSVLPSNSSGERVPDDSFSRFHTISSRSAASFASVSTSVRSATPVIPNTDEMIEALAPTPMATRELSLLQGFSSTLWTKPQQHSSASQQLNALATAIGQSLVARDWSAFVGFSRRSHVSPSGQSSASTANVDTFNMSLEHAASLMYDGSVSKLTSQSSTLRSPPLSIASNQKSSAHVFTLSHTHNPDTAEYSAVRAVQLDLLQVFQILLSEESIISAAQTLPKQPIQSAVNMFISEFNSLSSHPMLFQDQSYMHALSSVLLQSATKRAWVSHKSGLVSAALALSCGNSLPKSIYDQDVLMKRFLNNLVSVLHRSEHLQFMSSTLPQSVTDVSAMTTLTQQLQQWLQYGRGAQFLSSFELSMTQAIPVLSIIQNQLLHILCASATQSNADTLSTNETPKPPTSKLEVELSSIQTITSNLPFLGVIAACLRLQSAYFQQCTSQSSQTALFALLRPDWLLSIQVLAKSVLSRITQTVEVPEVSALCSFLDAFLDFVRSAHALLCQLIQMSDSQHIQHIQVVDSDTIGATISLLLDSIVFNSTSLLPSLLHFSDTLDFAIVHNDQVDQRVINSIIPSVQSNSFPSLKRSTSVAASVLPVVSQCLGLLHDVFAHHRGYSYLRQHSRAAELVTIFTRLHFNSFMRLNHAPQFNVACSMLVTLHVSCLLAIASQAHFGSSDSTFDMFGPSSRLQKSKSSSNSTLPAVITTTFYQLRVVMSLLREIDLEHNNTQENRSYLQGGGTKQETIAASSANSIAKAVAPLTPNVIVRRLNSSATASMGPTNESNLFATSGLPLTGLTVVNEGVDDDDSVDLHRHDDLDSTMDSDLETSDDGSDDDSKPAFTPAAPSIAAVAVPVAVAPAPVPVAAESINKRPVSASSTTSTSSSDYSDDSSDDSGLEPETPKGPPQRIKDILALSQAATAAAAAAKKAGGRFSSMDDKQREALYNATMPPKPIVKPAVTKPAEAVSNPAPVVTAPAPIANTPSAQASQSGAAVVSKPIDSDSDDSTPRQSALELRAQASALKAKSVQSSNSAPVAAPAPAKASSDSDSSDSSDYSDDDSSDDGLEPETPRPPPMVLRQMVAISKASSAAAIAAARGNGGDRFSAMDDKQRQAAMAACLPPPPVVVKPIVKAVPAVPTAASAAPVPTTSTNNAVVSVVATPIKPTKADSTNVSTTVAAPLPLVPSTDDAIQRSKRRLYDNPLLHIQIVRLLLRLLIAPQQTSLNKLYCDRMPIGDQGIDPSAATNLAPEHMCMNLPFVLHAHLNHPTQQSILSTLLQYEQSQYQTDSEHGASTLRLLRLLCCSYFNPEQYVDKVRIGMGRFGKVYVAQQQLTQQKVAVKWLDVPRNLEEDCVIFDLYSELTIMEQLKFQHNMVQLLEYGVDKGAYWVVMDYYPSSLRAWRTSLGKIDHDALNDTPASTSNLPLPSSQLRLCLSLFGRILQAMHTMQQCGIVHYDIKADNILIVPPEGIETDAAQFRLSFADFGQSSMQTSAIAAVFASLNPSNQNGNNQSTGDSFNSQLTWIGRGTENIQAPEMLSLSRQLNKQAVNFDRRKQSAVDGRADIWSLGCLFFELLTGEFLFEDDARSCLPFVLRVVDEEQPLITKEQEAMLGHNTHLIAFLRSVIVRQRFLRPSLADVQRRFESMCHALFPTTNSSSVAKSDDTIPVWFKYLESDDKKQTVGDKLSKKDDFDDTWVWGNNIHEPINEEHEFQAVHSMFQSLHTSQHDSFDPKVEELRALFQDFDASLAKCQIDAPIESAHVSHHAARLQPEPVSVVSSSVASGTSTTSSIVGNHAKSIVHVSSNLLIGSIDSLLSASSHIDPAQLLAHGITHIVECSALERRHALAMSNFLPFTSCAARALHHLNVEIDLISAPTKVSNEHLFRVAEKALQPTLLYIRTALTAGGRVLLLADSSSAAATISIVFLMRTYALSFAHALSQLQHARLDLVPSEKYSTVLRVLNDGYQQRRSKYIADSSDKLGDFESMSHYRCLCGACVISVDMNDLHKSIHAVTQTNCSCSPLRQSTSCPARGSLCCSFTLAQLKHVYGMTHSALEWTHVTAARVGGLTRLSALVEVSATESSTGNATIAVMELQKIGKLESTVNHSTADASKDSRVFKCRECNHVMLSAPTTLSLKQWKSTPIAIVSSLSVSNDVIRDAFGSVAIDTMLRDARPRLLLDAATCEH